MFSTIHPKAEDYVRSLLDRYDEPVLLEMEEEARRSDFPIVERAVGVSLEQLARAVSARRVFELGSGYGYSGYWFSRAVGPGGELHLTDADPANRDRAMDYLGRAGLAGPVVYHVGDALEALAAVEGEFDIVYCDIDKQGYPDAWAAARERVRPGGLYVCDNTLWYGRVAGTTDEPDPRPQLTQAIERHNRAVTADRGYLSTILPIRDGVLVALRLPG
ncbi:MAG TPA: O-methyltransferase [Actinomycetota bacterium]